MSHVAPTDDARHASPFVLPSLSLSPILQFLPPLPAIQPLFLSPFPFDCFWSSLVPLLLLLLSMLCSAPPGKSASNWLDRLRSNRGIPTGDDLDLDSFLANHPHPTSSDSFHSISEHTHSTKNRTRGSEISTADAHPTMSSVLAELFNVGGSLSRSSKLSGKKCPRKQTNPKFFVTSSLRNNSIDCCARKDDNAPATNSFSNDAAELKKENMDCCDVEEEKDNGGNELRGFSKSEVTVIDTSCSGWKVEKFVFRKNNVWKVRERKGKSKFFAKKKSKGSFGFDNHNSAIGKKEPKLLQYQFGSSSEKDRGEFVTPSTPVRAYTAFLYFA